ncbi:hypothetical protein MAPG_06170 [Magnaporthiopsis poae ATCC 64411]|uniref:Uncharacterized protein n=1 Tax=Magnaporthiopsis poae (strain ATCC 64411 / 73-15) TaxID=644358 RepID=A0A0C4E1B2_MAGP6|nr:hypothetical protein MAPG_06170 [Magnaporthiopsis poae ATCC 64411]
MMHILPVVASAMSLFSAVSGLALAQLPDGQNFNLFAYGGGLGGVKLCAKKDGAAYLVDTTKVDIAKAGVEPVQFTKQGSSWLATTDGANGGVKLNMAQFFVPRPNAASKSVGFLPVDADPAKVGQAETKGFEFYGKLALHVDQQSGALQTSFYAQPTDEEGVKALVWNATNDKGVKNNQVELRTVPPSSGPAIAASA